MVALFGRSELARVAHVFADNWRAIVALALLLVFTAFIALTYVGHSTSPYGMCYAPTGRPVPCEAIKP